MWNLGSDYAMSQLVTMRGYCRAYCREFTFIFGVIPKCASNRPATRPEIGCTAPLSQVLFGVQTNIRTLLFKKTDTQFTSICFFIAFKICTENACVALQEKKVCAQHCECTKRNK